VDHSDAEQWPAPLGRRHVTRDLGLGHVGIMLQRHRQQRRTRLVTATDAGKRNDRTDIAVAAAELLRLACGLERLALQSQGGGHGRLRSCSSYPPVIGGKKAISRAPEMAASERTWARSMAARITLGFLNAWAYSSPRPLSQITRSAIVATPA